MTGDFPYSEYLLSPFAIWLFILLMAVTLLYIFNIIRLSIYFFKNESYPLGKEELPFRAWVHRLAFWKAYLPEKFYYFLSKYDGTLPKEDYEKYKKDYDREMEVYPRQMLGIYLLIDLVILLVFLRIIFIFDHHLFGDNEHPMHVMIEHIDVAGLINGALATILAIIIARIVESENEAKKKELDNNIKKIKEATNKIDETNITIKDATANLKVEVEKILSSYTALERKDSFEERLEAYKHILDIARSNADNILYFMSFSADFGCLRSQNINVLLEESSSKPLHAESLYKAFNTFNTTIDELYLKLASICRERPEAVSLAFLDISDDNRQHKSPHQEYLERVLGDDVAKVIPWKKTEESDKGFNERINKYVDTEKYDEMAIYIDFEASPHHSGLNDRLTKTLVRKNIDRINDLKRIPKSQVTLMDRMEFQFLLTLPGKRGGIRNRSNQCCVITFSNIDAIGDNAGVYAFQSTDKDTIDNLKKIFETYKKQQESRNDKSKKDLQTWRNFKELFDIYPGSNCHNVLKFKILDEVVKEFLTGVAVADVQAALSIQQMFRQVEETIPEIKYSIQTNVNASTDYKDVVFDKEGTYFAIGLFGEGDAPETLAEYISSYYPDKFAFIRRPIDLYTTSSVSNEVSNILKVNGHQFHGVWNPNNKKDIGFIAKLRPAIKNKSVTVFIVGGINHFGTERIGEYLAGHWQEIHRIAQDKPFLAIYDIDDMLEEKVKLKHFYLSSLERDDNWQEIIY